MAKISKGIKTMTTLKKISAIACLFLAICLICTVAFAQETKTFIAYSMKVAQTRVEEAMRKGEDFHKRQPDLFYLGGITKPWAVVLDTDNNDWILVGERDPKSSVLTLDDWVAALRARFIYPDKDPGVTIDPRPCEACMKSGKKEGCSHFTKQDVRFFGGIEDTHFGKVCYEADWLMKKIGFSLEKLPIENIKTYFDLCIEQAHNSGISRTQVGSRFWFYPIINQVNVIGDVALLEHFKMGVFTEVLYAEVGGKAVADVDKFNHYPSEEFSRSFSENYDAIAQAREVLETLRGLTRLAALAKGLTQVDGKPKVDFYISGYPIVKSKTLQEVEVLKNENREVGCWVKGGVELMALAMRLKGGDTSALKELVLKGRKIAGAKVLTWSFEIQMLNGRLAGIVIPEGSVDFDQIVPLFWQAVFLYKQKRYDDSIVLYNKIIELNAELYEVYLARGVAWEHKGKYNQANSDYNYALKIEPRCAAAMYNKGVVLSKLGNKEEALNCYDKAITLDAKLVSAWSSRGDIYREKELYEQAMNSINCALEIDSRFADAWSNKGALLGDLKRYEEALNCIEYALELYCNNPRTWSNKGIILKRLGRQDEALICFEHAIMLDSQIPEVWINKGHTLKDLDNMESALKCYECAAVINPQNVDAWLNKGAALGFLERHNEALVCFNRVLEIDPDNEIAWYNKGEVLGRLGKYEESIQCFDQTLRINPLSSDGWYDKGISLYYLKKYKEAKKAFEKALDLGNLEAGHALEILSKKEY